MESAEKTTTFFRFEDLRIYHKAIDYVGWIYSSTNSIEDPSQDNLITRLNSAARDIAMNIAEGSARNKSQFIYYLKMAKSSIRECLVYSTVAFNLNYWNEEQRDYSRTQLMEMTKMIGALISSLQRGTRRDTSPDEERNDDAGNDTDY
ncbi:MAG: four helix bundle protein [Bacteroidales bacterium]